MKKLLNWLKKNKLEIYKILLSISIGVMILPIIDSIKEGNYMKFLITFIIGVIIIIAMIFIYNKQEEQRENRIDKKMDEKIEDHNDTLPKVG